MFSFYKESREEDSTQRLSGKLATVLFLFILFFFCSIISCFSIFGCYLLLKPKIKQQQKVKLIFICPEKKFPVGSPELKILMMLYFVDQQPFAHL